MTTPTFIEACLAGDRDPDDIDDYIDEWHAGGSGVPLWAFLGMTRDEYGAWVASPSRLPDIIRAYRLQLSR